MTVYADDYIPVIKQSGLSVANTTCALPSTTTIGGSAVLALTTVTSATATAISVGRQGATQPAFNIDCSTATCITGINLKSAASSNGFAITTLGGTNESLSIDAKGSGTLALNNAVAGTGGITYRNSIVDVTGATATLTVAQSGSIVLIDKADGCMITLPPPVVGLNYVFLNVLDQTSGANGFVTDAGTTYLLGSVVVAVVNSATSRAFVGTAGNLIRITTNKTTTGGLAGGCLTVTCITSTQWYVEGTLIGSGTPATPFSAS
jgi:hypothetical protein